MENKNLLTRYPTVMEKTNNTYTKKIVFGIVVFLFGFLAATTVHAETTVDTIINAPQPRIKIPGLNFTDGKTVAENISEKTGPAGTGQYVSIPYLGEYLAAIFRLAVVAASILAVIFIIVGGFVWTTSGGNPQRIESAKNIIGRALSGLIIAAASYVILFTINPNLVRFNNLDVLMIKRQDIQLTNFDSSDTFTGGDPASTPSAKSTFNYTINNYKQFDPRWKADPMECSAPYKDNMDIGSNGCGFVSSLIALDAFFPDKALDPKQLLQLYHGNSAGSGPSCSPNNDYLSPSFFANPWIQKQFPGATVRISKTKGDANALVEELKKGNLVVVLVGASALTKGGHYILVYDVEQKDGMYMAMVSDPGAGQPRCFSDATGGNLAKDAEIKNKIKSGTCGGGSNVDKCKACGGSALYGPNAYPLAYLLQAEKGARLIFEPPKK